MNQSSTKLINHQRQVLMYISISIESKACDEELTLFTKTTSRRGPEFSSTTAQSIGQIKYLFPFLKREEKIYTSGFSLKHNNKKMNILFLNLEQNIKSF